MRAFLPYGRAILFLAVSILARMACEYVAPVPLPFFVTDLALVVIVWRCGLGPGLMAAVLSVLTTLYFFIEPRFSLQFTKASDMYELALMSLQGIGIVLASYAIALSRAEVVARDRIGFALAGKPLNRILFIIGAVAATGLVIVSSMTPHRLFDRMDKAREGISHALDVQNDVYDVVVVVRALQRDLSETAKAPSPGNLARLQSDLDELPNEVQDVVGQTADNPVQQSRVQTLRSLADDAITKIRAEIRHGKVGADDVLPGDFDQMNRIIDDVMREEGRLLAKRRAASERELEGSTIMMALVTVGTALTFLLTLGLLYADSRRRLRLEHDLEDARRKAAAASQAKSAFLANMSHEIRTPLGAIMGFSEFLDLPNLSKEERASYIATIHRNGRALLQVVNDVLDLSKIEAGRLEIDCQPLDLQTLINDIESTLSLRAREKGLRFSVDWLGRAPRLVSTDETRLRQILLNVIGNAIKFTDKGSVAVAVSWTPNGEGSPRGDLSFTVSDTGVGMTAEQQARIFQPFMQADAGMTRRFGGTGLGLVLSRELCKALGGDLTLERSAIGQGTTFVARLSAVAGREDAAEVRPASSKPAGGLTGVRVLLADDSTDNQVLISRLLAQAGATVEIVDNGRAAVARCRAQDFDVVLMDVQMPVVDGYEATSTLRKSGYKRPIIALSAHAMKEDYMRSLRAGCNEHVTKPVSRSDLIGIIAKFAAPRERPAAH